MLTALVLTLSNDACRAFLDVEDRVGCTPILALMVSDSVEAMDLVTKYSARLAAEVENEKNTLADVQEDIPDVFRPALSEAQKQARVFRATIRGCRTAHLSRRGTAEEWMD